MLSRYRSTEFRLSVRSRIFGTPHCDVHWWTGSDNQTGTGAPEAVFSTLSNRPILDAETFVVYASASESVRNSTEPIITKKCRPLINLVVVLAIQQCRQDRRAGQVLMGILVGNTLPKPLPILDCCEVVFSPATKSACGYVGQPSSRASLFRSRSRNVVAASVSNPRD